MANVWFSFHQCGSPAFLILLLTVLGFLGAAAAAILLFTSKNRTMSILAASMPLVIGTLTFAVGELGKLRGEAQTEAALKMASVSSMPKEYFDEIRIEGRQEAAQCVSIGIGGGTLPLVFGLILLPIAFFQKKPEPSTN